MNYGIAGIDHGTVHIGVAWRDGKKVLTETAGWSTLGEVLAKLHGAGVRVAKVECNPHAPMTRKLREALVEAGIACEQVMPLVVAKRLPRQRVNGRWRKETRRMAAARIAKNAGATPGNQHEADAVAAMVYGEHEKRKGIV